VLSSPEHGPCPIGQRGRAMRTFQSHIKTVVAAEEMDDETFLLHFENRHYDQLPDIQGFADTIHQQPELISTYRSFHDKIHDLVIPGAMKEPHEHTE
jgi:hypothetical protein